MAKTKKTIKALPDGTIQGAETSHVYGPWWLQQALKQKSLTREDLLNIIDQRVKCIDNLEKEIRSMREALINHERRNANQCQTIRRDPTAQEAIDSFFRDVTPMGSADLLKVFEAIVPMMYDSFRSVHNNAASTAKWTEKTLTAANDVISQCKPV